MPEIVAYKRLEKLPRVVLEGNMLNKIKQWYRDNHLSPLVPPIFNKFVIEYPGGAKMLVPESMLGVAAQWGFVLNPDAASYASTAEFPRELERLEPHVWTTLDVKIELLVEYSPSLTEVYVTAYEDGRRALSSSLDYNDYNSETGVWKIGVEVGGSFDEETIRENESALHDQIESALAVQNYILYHRSEEIAEPKVIKVRPKAGKGAKSRGKRSGENTITMRHRKRRTIIIREGDEVPRKKYNYRTLAWNVRGHYARRGNDKHIVYIAPFICHRGDGSKKPRKSTYRITEGEEV